MARSVAERATKMNEPTVAQALAGASKLFTTGECLRVLAREYRLMQAAIERVRALPPVELEPAGGTLMLIGMPVTVSVGFEVLDRADVLAALRVGPPLPGQILRD